jgi:hypothetical protein
MLYVKNVVPAMRATVKTNKPMYIHILRAFFFSTISSGVKNDKTIPPWFGSWLAGVAPIALRHHLSMILPLISPYHYYIDNLHWKLNRYKVCFKDNSK